MSERDTTNETDSTLRRLSLVAARSYTDPGEAIAAILGLMRDIVGLRTALVTEADGDVWRATHVVDDAFGIEPGATLRLSDMLCSLVSATNEPIVVNDAAADHPHRAYPMPAAIGARTFIGVPLVLSDGTVYGTLCAIDRQVSALGTEDIAVLRVLARLVAHELERERRLQAVRDEGERRFQALVQHSSDVIAVLDADGTVLKVSPAVERLFGYGADEPVGHNIFSFLHPEDVAGARSSFAEALTGGPAAKVPIEVRLRHSDDSWRWVEAIGDNRLADPDIGGFVLNGRDVTERKHVEAALRSSEARLKAFLEATPDLFFRIHRDGTFLDYSATDVTLLYSAPDAIVGSRLHDLLPPAVAARAAAAVARTLATAVPEVFDFRLPVPKGERDFEARWIVSGADEVLCVVRDVTQQRAAEAALRQTEAHETVRQSEARFRSLVQNASDLISVLDADATIRYASPAIEPLLGYRPDEIVGQSYRVFIHPDDLERTEHALAMLLSDPTCTPRIEIRARHASGSWHRLEATGRNLLADPNVAGLVVNTRDVTARNALAEAAAHAAALKRSDELKTALLAAVSHELRTPLATIKTSVTSLLDPAVGRDEAARAQFLRGIDEETDRLTRTIGNLLDLSRLEGGALRADRAWYDLDELVADVAERLAPLADRHRLTTEVAPGLPSVRLDYVQIAQVLMNLAENALKYAPPRTAIVMSARAVAGAVELAVSDEGPGVPAAELERIFDRFYRVAPTGKVAGTGIGLALSKGLVEANGGRIWAEAGERGGLTVRLTLPIDVDREGTEHER